MKVFKGKVTKKSNPKTLTVLVERVVVHPVYKKRYKQTKTYHVHDEGDSAKAGETVEFVASKPYSKTKRWSVVNQNTKKTKISKK